MRKSVRVQLVAVAILGVLAAALWYAIAREDRGGKLTVSFLAVGKGEAILIDMPSGRQVLIDGGPDGSVLRQLGALMAPWDRSLDLVIATSANKGDVSGLIDVLQRYRVDTVLQTSVEDSSVPWYSFEKGAAASGTSMRTARRGQIIDLGTGAQLEVLFPDRNLLASGAGEGCVVTRLVYGKTAFLFPCDATTGVQNYLAALDGSTLRADVLTVSASQAKTFSPILLGYVSPKYVVYSGTCAASSTLPAFSNAETLDTCGGTVSFVSDGKIVSGH